MFQVLNIQPFFEVCPQGPEVEEAEAERLAFAQFPTKMKQLPETKGAPVDARGKKELISSVISPLEYIFK